jgi:PAS domain S-box-containing protein
MEPEKGHHDESTARPHRDPLTGHGDGPPGYAFDDPASTPIGWFRYYFDDDRWEWSAEVAQMHGYQPGTLVPTTELILSHTHSDDYQQIADTLGLIREPRQPFRSRHRICDAHGKVREVAVLGDQFRDEDGRVVGTYGFFVDLTKEEQARQDWMTAEITRISQRRFIIERAKGMLMMVYSLDEATAFELLKWRSQGTNIKLVQLAGQIAADFTAVQHHGEMSQAIYDLLFMTAHTRARQANS